MSKKSKNTKRGLLIGLCSVGGVLAIVGTVVAIALVDLKNVLSDWDLDMELDDLDDVDRIEG